MWTFYYEVSQAAAVPGDIGGFAVLVIATALIILAPSYFERKNK